MMMIRTSTDLLGYLNQQVTSIDQLLLLAKPSRLLHKIQLLEDLDGPSVVVSVRRTNPSSTVCVSLQKSLRLDPP